MGRRIITAIVICALALSGICISADENRTDSDKKHMTGPGRPAGDNFVLRQI